MINGRLIVILISILQPLLLVADLLVAQADIIYHFWIVFTKNVVADVFEISSVSVEGTYLSVQPVRHTGTTHTHTHTHNTHTHTHTVN